MEIIKEIRELSNDISVLKESIKKYDKEISIASANSSNINKMFSHYKGANASALSVDELSKAIKNLSNGYNSLSAAQSSYTNKENAVLSTIQKITEQNKLLLESQRHALSNGDQQGATQIYQQYVSNTKAIQQYQAELNTTRDALERVQEKTAQLAQENNKFAQVQQAVNTVTSTNNISDLLQSLDKEKQKIKDISIQIEEYAQKYKSTKKIIENGSLSPIDMDAKTMDLEMYKNKLQELSNAYNTAAQRARIFADATGGSMGNIPLQPQGLPLESNSSSELQTGVDDATGKMKRFSDVTKEAGNSLDDVIKKGLAFGGISFGANQLMNFGRQVMSVRGEFQQLEVAFTTLLGSEQKANNLMQQLTKTAATTPFDLQSVSKGAKQLLAYGTAAEDVNDILVHLGDIAAGLSQPLDALVYLYGTTMTQGKMMTMDLRQFQNRGIPIADQLAKQFGVAKSEVQGLVSSGRVTAEEFHKAIMAMSSDGGKFGGLMAAQSKTISGQISNIEDSISMMFNDIGKKSEGGINVMLEGVSLLVENYEVVGKVLLSLITTYGIYKAALIAVAAVEQVRHKMALYSMVNNGKQISGVQLLTKTIYKQVKAQLASNAAMLANPAVLITAGIAAMGLAIWGVTKALDSQARAQKEVNKESEKTNQELDNIKSESEEAISVIQSETSTLYEKAAAYEKLKRLMPQLTEQYTMQQLAIKDATEIQKEEAKILEELKFKKQEEAIANEKANLESLKHQREATIKYGGTTLGVDRDIKTSNEKIRLLEEEYEKMKKIKADAEFEAQPVEVKLLKYTTDKEGLEERLKDLQQQADIYIKEAREKWDEVQEKSPQLNKLQYGTDDFEIAVGKNASSVVGDKYVLLLKQIKELQAQIESTQSKIDILNAEETRGILDVIDEIIIAEKTLDSSRKKYASNMSEQNKKDLETAESNLKTKTDLYQKATGKQWTLTKDYYKQISDLDKQNENQRTNIIIQEYGKRAQLITKYQQDQMALEKEISEWREKNPYRGLPKHLRNKSEVIRLQYESNIRQAEKEFENFIENIEKQTLQINTDIETQQLERSIELASTYEQKIAKQNELFKRQIELKESDFQIEKKKTLEQQFSEATIDAYNNEEIKGVVNEYKNAKSEDKESIANDAVKRGVIKDRTLLDAFEDDFAKIEEVSKLLETQHKATINQMLLEQNESLFEQDLQRYEDYIQGMLDAEQQYQEELARIREENGLSADADIENSKDKGIQSQVQRAKDQRDTAQDIVKRDTGLTDDKWVTELGNLGAQVAGKAYDEVKKLYDEFISTVNDDIAEIEAQKVAAEKNANGGDVKTLKAETQEQLYGVETQLQDPNLKEQQKVDLLQQQLELKAQIAYYDAAEQGNAETLNSLTERGAQLVKVRNKAESDAANAKQRSNVKELTQQQKVKVANKSIVQGLESVRDMANDVANTFGGALSKKAKKALETMTQVADFGIDAVKGIETIVSGVSDGMIKTTAGASASMQALEKASFILTVISIAVQLIMKIVEIASQFTKSAQLQNSIDDHLAKVDELEKRQQMIEAQYATSQGSEYYKGLTDSARAYNGIIKANKEALEEAEELYNHNLSKYGADSEKTEEAKAQLDDLALQDVEYQNSQKEAWRSLMEELSGTSLDSFAENLADALIEGFAQGKEGIDEVWEDTMDDLLRTMMRNELALALKDQFKETFEKFTEDTKDGDLSQAEMDKFMENLEKGKETAEKIAGAYYDAMSEAGLLEDADAEGSQGFGQMTQDQADTLTARFTALQIEGANISAATQAMAAVVAEVGADTKLNVASLQTLVYNSNIALQIAQDQLDQMQIIADNTAMLAETNNRLKAIEQNTGRL